MHGSKTQSTTGDHSRFSPGLPPDAEGLRSLHAHQRHLRPAADGRRAGTPGVAFAIFSFVPVFVTVNLAVVLGYRERHFKGIRKYVTGVVAAVILDASLVYILFIILIGIMALGSGGQ